MLLEKGFSGYEIRKIVSEGDCLGTLEIAGGQEGTVELLASEDFDYALAAGEIPEIVLPGPGFVYAPVVQGAEAGKAHICIGKKEIGEVTLIYGDTIEKTPEEERSLWEKLFGEKDA